jgi:biotin synthase-related radical SAM superfamily protein
LFGKNQVSSFIILGLGEKPQSAIEGVKLLCDMGVYSFIVPLRPIPGTPLGMTPPPKSDYMISIYEQAAVILKESGLSWKNSKAGCVRCGACSGLPDFEDET